MITDELDDTKSYYQLIIKIKFSEKRIANSWKKGKICIKLPAEEISRQKHKSKRAHART